MDITKIAEIIFHKWKIDLKGLNRSKDHIANNFDLLVEGWSSADVPRDIADNLMKNAVKEHYAPRSVERAIYRKNKPRLRGTTEDEFIEDWRKMIESEAYQVFYLHYPLEIIKKKQTTYGSMSKQEYMRQMAYASTYPEANMNNKKEEHNLTNDEVDLESL